MAVVVRSGAVVGVEAIPIRVEADLLRRLPAMCIVGLAASAVKESAERIRSAVVALGEEFPRKRIVVNLAPADVRKEGTALDLPIALAILAGDGRLPMEALDRVLAVGELALGGELRPVRGAISLALLAREQDRVLLLPRSSAPSAALVPGAQVVGAEHLGEVVRWLRGEQALHGESANMAQIVPSGVDMADVRGQAIARHALEVAAAGAHHLLMVGPPGCGKSMLARRLPTILPPLSSTEALEVTQVHSAAGLLEGDALMAERPFRAPHHSVTVAGLIGDHTLRPGEIALAHHGVLFLDEATEFVRPALEVLRQPLEEGTVRLCRAKGSLEYPAQITMVMACNPCPCGRRGTEACSCGDGVVQRYQRKLSGPLLDRVDLHLELHPVPPRALMSARPGEPSSCVRERVIAARERQQARGQRLPNGQVPVAELERIAQPTEQAREELVKGAEEKKLSGRGTGRVLRVARTLADLDGAERVEQQHVLGALGLRPSIGWT